jgi:predicted dehydrogenase
MRSPRSRRYQPPADRVPRRPVRHDPIADTPEPRPAAKRRPRIAQTASTRTDAHQRIDFSHRPRREFLDDQVTGASGLSLVASSGGIFRDCAIHDFDVVRRISGQEVVEVYAAGSNQGAPYFREHGDVDTAAALLVLEHGTLGLVSNSRYNGRGYDVRVEVRGSEDSVAAGIESWTRPRVPGTRLREAVDRFGDAYRSELRAFIEVVHGNRPSPCTLHDGLEAFWIAEACDRSMRQGRSIRLEELRDAASASS